MFFPLLIAQGDDSQWQSLPKELTFHKGKNAYGSQDLNLSLAMLGLFVPDSFSI